MNVLRGTVEPIPVAQLSDGSDCYLVCDRETMESIEIGFVGGREEPELFMQDGGMGGVTAGQVFTNDQLLFKVRWSFGGGWIDYRGRTGARSPGRRSGGAKRRGGGGALGRQKSAGVIWGYALGCAPRSNVLP